VASGTGSSPDVDRLHVGRTDADAPRSSLPEAYAALDKTKLDKTKLDTTAAAQPDSVRRSFGRRLRRGRDRFGLRVQATLTLAVGALLVSVAVATLTYVVARRSLVAERRSVVQQLVFSDAAEVQSALSRSGSNVAALLRRQNQRDLSTVLFVDAEVYTSTESLSSKRIPDSLRELVSPGTLAAKVPAVRTPGDFAYQIVRHSGRTELVVGVPLTALEAEFYGVASLADVESRLRSLARTLAIAALLSSVGAALVGRTVIRRALRPLSDVASGAADISSGRLDTRLPLTGDADLDPLLASFNDMAQTLQDRIEREARFASDVSHELRTPLTALVTAAGLLDGRRDELGERSQKTLDVLVTQTAHFERLVLDLLEISRFDAGAAELHAEVVQLPELVRAVIRVNGSDAAVEWLELDPPEMCVDKRRVERMIANLLQNAANYGGGAISVRLVNAPDDASGEGPRHVHIVVDDAGPGVPEAERAVIFERFRRGQSQQRATSAPKGTGLGLSLVRAHANLHGGDVWVEDRPGGGARFVVDIAEGAVQE
jgi:two-component system, OmpR family, sensor histidine kinase MtrB